MQLSLDAADRLAAALTARQEPLSLREVVRLLLRADRVPAALARRVVAEVVAGDARFRWRSAEEVALAAWWRASSPLEQAAFCVIDLETTGMQPGHDRIVEIGAVRVEALEITGQFERLVDPGIPVPAAITRLTGISGATVDGRARIGTALELLLRFAGGAALVAHNARFDVGFLDAELRRTRGRRLACPVVDTVGLARRLLPGRQRYSLASLADRFATSARPCHRALPDALATAEILLVLIGRAQERGATTLDDLVALSAPPARQAHGKRRLAERAPSAPGTYVMRDGGGRALYVGTARDLRRRTLAYFRGGAQPRAVERVLGAVERVEFRQAGSAFEARLDELRLIDGLRPVANRRGARPDRLAYLRLDDGPVPRLAVSGGPGLDGALYAGPVGSRHEAERLAQSLRLVYGLRSCRRAAPVEDGCLEGRLGRCLAPCRGGDARGNHMQAAAALAEALRNGGGVPVARLRARRRTLVGQLRFEEAAVLRDAEAGLRAAGVLLGRLRDARRCHGVLVARGGDAGPATGFAVAFGLEVERRALPATGEARLESSALIAAVERGVAGGAGLEGPAAVPAERREEALLIGATFRRPPLGVAAVPWTADRGAFLAAIAAARVVRPGGGGRNETGGICSAKT
jgi:DNA polymerase-3 subunit epsilon